MYQLNELLDEIAKKTEVAIADGKKLTIDKNKLAGSRSRVASLEIGKLWLQWRKLSVKK